MKRTKIQRIIIPRNWLFGRLTYMYANLSQMLSHSHSHFTEHELSELDEAYDKIGKIISSKKLQSERLKKQIVNNHKN